MSGARVPPPADAVEAAVDKSLERAMAHYAGDLHMAAGMGCCSSEQGETTETAGGCLPLCFGTVYGLVLGVGLTLLVQWVVR